MHKLDIKLVTLIILLRLTDPFFDTKQIHESTLNWHKSKHLPSKVYQNCIFKKKSKTICSSTKFNSARQSNNHTRDKRFNETQTSSNWTMQEDILKQHRDKTKSISMFFLCFIDNKQMLRKTNQLCPN